MGVPAYFRWCCARFPKVIKDAVEREADGEMDDEDDLNPNGEYVFYIFVFYVNYFKFQI